ncbi:MAG: FIG084569: hydrolase, alpha/beta fold family [uncultured Paraburkholderia sp.]|nr:MAG: FIG084569: hydrolase, alpha/beta fold family [uncultured Paraburkholderia sp.]CAH2915458.1 MAG: FIG084569: hydrolase, alpha/beta fold family [uncultured Paraburkholderia sp.]
MSTWILLRGLTREARHWGRLPELLRDAVNAHHLLLIDLPGNGEFAGLRAPAQVAGMIEFVRDTAKRMGATGPFNVFAMSLGGMVATQWAQRYPHDIERLVLVNMSMRPFSRMQERLRPAAWPALLGVARHWRDAERVERVIHRLTCNNTDTFEADLRTWCEIRRSAPMTRGNALRQLRAAARFTAAATRPQCLLLILSSREDRLVDPVCSANVATAWGAAHAEHASASHDLPHDDPVWTSAQVRAWLAPEPARADSAT